MPITPERERASGKALAFLASNGNCRVSELIITPTRRVYYVNWNLCSDSRTGNLGLEAACSLGRIFHMRLVFVRRRYHHLGI
jgi:hypothetical protein